jgi:hypothetical protein
MTKRKTVIVAVIALLVIAAAVIFFKTKVKLTDPQPAIAVGTQFFENLKGSRIDDAFNLYSDEFKNMQGEAWHDFLRQLQVRGGPISSVELVSTAVVPFEGQACYAVVYKTLRNVMQSREQLIICPTPHNRMAVVGHEMVRLDTNQRVSAGMTVTQVGVRIP